jgi:bifunctional DNase/RNase
MEKHAVAEDAENLLVEMRVTDVRKRPEDPEKPIRHVIILGEVGGDRSLLIWVGPFEGTAIAWQLEGAETPRPMTHAFTAGVLRAAGGRLREIRITRLSEETFYATAIVEGASGMAEVDARPSDAIALGLMLGAPIRVHPAVLAADETNLEGAATYAARLTGLREQSAGPAEIVAEAKEKWWRWPRRAGEAAEPPPVEPTGSH